MKRYFIVKAAALLMLLSLLLPAVFAGASVSAEQTGASVVSFASPAIPCDAGQTVELSEYKVVMTSGGAAVAVEWSSSELEISGGRVTPAAAGVYALKATAGNTSRSVYVVAKNPSDSEYILYSADFSSSETAGIRQAYMTNGASWSVADGKLVMNAGAKSQSIRLMFPEWLGAFGDYRIEAVGTIKSAYNTARWTSVMFRANGTTYPYYQMAVRQKATAENGTEFAERTPADAWSVTHTAPYTESISASKSYTFTVEAKGASVATYIDGNRLVYAENASKYLTGQIGLQVNQCTAEYTSFTVKLINDEIEASKLSFAEVYEPTSNIILPPVIATGANTAEEIRELKNGKAAVAFLRVAGGTSPAVVSDGGTVLMSLEEAIAAADLKVIPAFVAADSETAVAVAAYLKETDFSDAYIVGDAAAVTAARKENNKIYAILDCRGRTELSAADLITLRTEANTAGARVIMLPDKLVSRENVEYLQQLLMTVWSAAEGKIGQLAAVTAGVNGILTSDPAELEKIYTDYFERNSVIRTVGVIAHRGSTTYAQENSLAGAIKSYELGATAVENDIYLTADGKLVVMHDSTLDRTTNGTGNVTSMTLAQIQQYKIDGISGLATEPIPTLEDYFKEFKSKDFRIIIELKSSSVAVVEPLVTLVKQYDILDQISVISFHEEPLLLLKQRLPGISCGFLLSPGYMNESNTLPAVAETLKQTQPLDSTFNPSYKTGLGYNFIKAMSYRGLTIWPYTINDKSDFSTYSLYGVGAITTNYSQWVTDIIKNVSAAGAAEVNVGESKEFSVSALTYGGEEKTVDAQMIMVDGVDGISYSEGKLTASAPGTATVIFRVRTRNAGGIEINLTTEPVVITVSEKDNTISTDAATEAPAGAEKENKKGCGGISVAAQLVAILCGGAAFVFFKKK